MLIKAAGKIISWWACCVRVERLRLEGGKVDNVIR
jgi:hypothetical protein